MTTKETILQQTIIEELGLGGLPQEKQDELLVQIGEAVMKRIYLEIMEKLDKDEQEKLAGLIDNNPDGIEAFVKDKIPDYNEFVKGVVDEFKKEMKEDMGLTN
jgi:hypothetical protein